MNVTPLRNSVGRIGTWIQLPFFRHNGPFDDICARLTDERRPILPAGGNILRAFELTRREDVRVVIIGQDPYPNWNPRLAAGLATGLAFAVPDCTVTLPTSLERIFDKIPNHRTGPNLEYWAAQGVLLLNTILTIPVDTVNGSQKGVNEGERSHRDFGWESLIGDALADLTHSNDVFFMFFGVSARDKKIIPQNLLNQLSQVNQATSQVIGVSHPSDRGRLPNPPWVPFSTSSPFTQANNFFQGLNPQYPPIIW